MAERTLVKRANGNYDPKPEHKFSFGLWTVGNRGRDTFGDFVRPVMPPEEIVAMLAEVGAWGVNPHDNIWFPSMRPPAEGDKIAVQKTMRAMDVVAELGSKVFVLWGGREGVETDACRRPEDAVKRLR